MVNKRNQNTESEILEAAKNVFQRKGMFGARMQEIANEAGINKALLHYYYRSKQLLFEAVFKQAFNLMGPKLNEVLNSDLELEEKIRAFTSNYISFVIKHPYLPNFIIQELNSNPEFVEQLIAEKNFPNILKFKEQVEGMVAKGEIRCISGEQLFVNVLSLSIFPFIAAPLLKGFTKLNDKAYAELLEDNQRPSRLFGPKYWFGRGTTYYMNLYFRF